MDDPLLCVCVCVHNAPNKYKQTHRHKYLEQTLSLESNQEIIIMLC